MKRIGQATLSAIVVIGVAACSDSTSSKVQVVTAAAIPGTDRQSAPAGTALSAPLQVLVLVNGKPAAGISVSWSPASGSIAIISGITDADGVASGRWILGPEPGELAAYATVSGALGSPVQFTATATSSRKAETAESSTDQRSTP